ncbi:MAG: amino acid transporter [Lasallia pustulata]|uniref:Amino acid transporter n=1 Tax=Lasallia pustulata TaxID=136370 RepID=A0A5M8PZ55_9LECA|nr:MAG: amino acid transporter [Lasallia pustulata]
MHRAIRLLTNKRITALMTAILSAGMAELASAYPVAGAQYYWSFMVASPKRRPLAAYVNGWISVLGWWVDSAAVCNFISSMILSIVALWYPDYAIQHWQQWLVYVLLVWLVVAINVLGSRLIPAFNKMILGLACTSLTATSITLLICSRHRYPPPSFVFGDHTNSSGWSSDGFAFVLAVANAVWAFLGTDCGAHLCEEIPNPGRNVPKVIMYPIAMGLVAAAPFAMSCMAAITDVTAVLQTASGLPLIEIYYQGTGSRVGATILMALFTFCFFGCAVAVGTTSSRTLWAVSRDGALPFSSIWMRVSPRFLMPVNAMLLSATIISLYGLIFLGSTTAFSAMIGASIIFLQTSCIIPQAILLYRGREKVLPERYFNLGKYGTAFNATAVVWVVFLDVVYCMPVARPVTKANMNYVSVVAVGSVGFVFALWFATKRRTFVGPRVDVELMMRRREEALHVHVSQKGDLELGSTKARVNAEVYGV